MSEAKGYKIQVIERATDILRCFLGNPVLGIADISRMVNLPKSTVFGIVDTLVSCEMLTRDPITNKYQLGLQIFLLSLSTNTNLRTVVLPYLRRLVSDFGETANLVTHDDTHLIYLDKLESPHAMRICTTIGLRLPFYCSGVGRSMLAFMPEKNIELAISSYDYKPYTQNTIRDAATLREQLKTIRQQRYCLDDEEFESGIFCVGVPILTPRGYPMAGISVSGPKPRMTEDVQARIIASLLDYSQQISDDLFNAD